MKRDGHKLTVRYYGMLERCYNPRSPKYANWGGRGIKVCEEWRTKGEGFESFVRHLESLPHCYEKGRLLDRVNNDGNYEPGNVRWATSSQQNLNKRMMSTNTSGYANIRYRREHKRWVVNFRHKHVGQFSTLEEAMVARDAIIKAVEKTP